MLLFELVHVVWAGLPPADASSPSPKAKEDAPRSYAPADDGCVTAELERDEAQIVALAEALAADRLEEFNGRMAAKAMYLSKVRDLLDQQLKPLRA